MLWESDFSSDPAALQEAADIPLFLNDRTNGYKWHSTARMCCQDWMSGIKTIIKNRYGRRSIPATLAGKCNDMLSTACHKAFETMARLMEDKH